MSLMTNKIYLGDAYKLIKEIPDDSIDCIYVDVPYLYEIKKNKNTKKTSKLTRTMKRSHDELVEYDLVSGFDYSILDDFVRILKTINIFIWVSQKQIYDIYKVIRYRILLTH